MCMCKISNSSINPSLRKTRTEWDAARLNYERCFLLRAEEEDRDEGVDEATLGGVNAML